MAKYKSKRVIDPDSRANVAQDLAIERLQNSYMSKGMSYEDAYYASVGRTPNKSASTAPAAPAFTGMVGGGEAGIEVPTSELKWDQDTFELGAPLFYDTQKNSITGIKSSSAVPLYKDKDGSLSFKDTGSVYIYDAWTASILSGKSIVDESLPDVSDIAPGDRLYLDLVSNKFVNKPTATTLGMYFENYAADIDKYAKEKGIAGISSRKILPGELPADFWAESGWTLADNEGAAAEGRQPYIATQSFIDVIKQNKEYAEALRQQAKMQQDALAKPSTFSADSVIKQGDTFWKTNPSPFAPLNTVGVKRLFQYAGNIFTGKEKSKPEEWKNVMTNAWNDFVAGMGAINPLAFIYGPEGSASSTSYIVNEKVPTTNYGRDIKSTFSEDRPVDPDTEVIALEIQTEEYFNLPNLLNYGAEYANKIISKMQIRNAKDAVALFRAGQLPRTSANNMDTEKYKTNIELMATFADNAPGVMDRQSAMKFLDETASRQNQIRTEFFSTMDIAKQDKLIQEMTDIYRGQEYARTFLGTSSALPITLDWGFYGEPVRYQSFLEARARLELQKGTTLNHAETRSLIESFANPVTSLYGNMLVDPVNLLDLVGIGPLVNSVSKVLGKTRVAGPLVKTLVGLSDEVSDILKHGDDAIAVAKEIAELQKPGVRLAGTAADIAKDFRELNKLIVNESKLSSDIFDQAKKAGKVFSAKGARASTEEFDAWQKLITQIQNGQLDNMISGKVAKKISEIEKKVNFIRNTSMMGKDAVFDAINTVKFRGRLGKSWVVSPFGDQMSMSDFYAKPVLGIIFGPAILPLRAFGKLGAHISRPIVNALSSWATSAHFFNPFRMAQHLMESSYRTVQIRTGALMYNFANHALVGADKSLTGVNYKSMLIDRINLVMDKISPTIERLRSDPQGTWIDAARLLSREDKSLGALGNETVHQLFALSKFFTKEDMVEGINKVFSDIEAEVRGRFDDKFVRSLIPVDVYNDISHPLRNHYNKLVQARIADEVEKALVNRNLIVNKMREVFSDMMKSKITVKVGMASVDIGSTWAEIKARNPIIGSLTHMVFTALDFLNRIWIDATLARRPQWLVNNVVESTFRAMVVYGNPFGFGRYYTMPIQRIIKSWKEAGLPVELVQSFSLDSGLDLLQEGILEKGFIGSIPSLAKKSIIDAWNNTYKRYPIPGLKPFSLFWVPVKSLSNMISSMNQVFESTIRLRFAYMLFDQNMKKAEKSFVEGITTDILKELRQTGLPESEVQKYAKVFLSIISGTTYDPELTKLSTDRDASFFGQYIGSLILNPEVAGTPLADTFGENRMLLHNILRDIGNYIIDMTEKGKVPTEEDVVGLVDYTKHRLLYEGMIMLRPDIAQQVVDTIAQQEGTTALETLIELSGGEAMRLYRQIENYLGMLKPQKDTDLAFEEDMFSKVQAITGKKPSDLLEAKSLLETHVIQGHVKDGEILSDASRFVMTIGDLEEKQLNEVQDAIENQFRKDNNPFWHDYNTSAAYFYKNKKNAVELAARLEEEASSEGNKLEIKDKLIDYLLAVDEFREHTSGKLKNFLLHYAPDAPRPGDYRSVTSGAWRNWRMNDNRMAVAASSYLNEANYVLRRFLDSADPGDLSKLSMPKLTVQRWLSFVDVALDISGDDTAGYAVTRIDYKGRAITDEKTIKQMLASLGVDYNITPAQYGHINLSYYQSKVMELMSKYQAGGKTLAKAQELAKKELLTIIDANFGEDAKIKLDKFGGSLADLEEHDKAFREITDPVGKMRYLLDLAEIPTAFPKSASGDFVRTMTWTKSIEAIVRKYNPGSDPSKVENVYNAVRKYVEYNAGMSFGDMKAMTTEQIITTLTPMVESMFFDKYLTGTAREDAALMTEIWARMASIATRYGEPDESAFDTLAGLYKYNENIAPTLGMTSKRYDEFMKDRVIRLRQAIVSFQGANPTTAIHEFTHVTYNFLKELAYQKGIKELQDDLDVWDNEASKWLKTVRNISDPTPEMLNEARVVLFEKYILDDYLEARSLSGIFAKLKRTLIQAYQALKDYLQDVKVSPRLRRLFDKMMSEESYKKHYASLAGSVNFGDIESGDMLRLANKVADFNNLDKRDQVRVANALNRVIPYMNPKHKPGDLVMKLYAGVSTIFEMEKRHKLAIKSGNVVDIANAASELQRAKAEFMDVQVQIQKGLRSLNYEVIKSKKQQESKVIEAVSSNVITKKKQADPTIKSNVYNASWVNGEGSIDNIVRSATYDPVSGTFGTESEFVYARDGIMTILDLSGDPLTKAELAGLQKTSSVLRGSKMFEAEANIWNQRLLTQRSTDKAGLQVVNFKKAGSTRFEYSRPFSTPHEAIVQAAAHEKSMSEFESKMNKTTNPVFMDALHEAETKLTEESLNRPIMGDSYKPPSKQAIQAEANKIYRQKLAAGELPPEIDTLPLSAYVDKILRSKKNKDGRIVYTGKFVEFHMDVDEAGKNTMKHQNVYIPSENLQKMIKRTQSKTASRSPEDMKGFAHVLNKEVKDIRRAKLGNKIVWIGEVELDVIDPKQNIEVRKPMTAVFEGQNQPTWRELGELLPDVDFIQTDLPSQSIVRNIEYISHTSRGYQIRQASEVSQFFTIEMKTDVKKNGEVIVREGETIIVGKAKVKDGRGTVREVWLTPYKDSVVKTKAIDKKISLYMDHKAQLNRESWRVLEQTEVPVALSKNEISKLPKEGDVLVHFLNSSSIGGPQSAKLIDAALLFEEQNATREDYLDFLSKKYPDNMTRQKDVYLRRENLLLLGTIKQLQPTEYESIVSALERGDFASITNTLLSLGITLNEIDSHRIIKEFKYFYTTRDLRGEFKLYKTFELDRLEGITARQGITSPSVAVMDSYPLLRRIRNLPSTSAEVGEKVLLPSAEITQERASALGMSGGALRIGSTAQYTRNGKLYNIEIVQFRPRKNSNMVQVVVKDLDSDAKFYVSVNGRRDAGGNLVYDTSKFVNVTEPTTIPEELVKAAKQAELEKDRIDAVSGLAKWQQRMSRVADVSDAEFAESLLYDLTEGGSLERAIAAWTLLRRRKQIPYTYLQDADIRILDQVASKVREYMSDNNTSLKQYRTVMEQYIEATKQMINKKYPTLGNIGSYEWDSLDAMNKSLRQMGLTDLELKHLRLDTVTPNQEGKISAKKLLDTLDKLRHEVLDESKGDETYLDQLLKMSGIDFQDVSILNRAWLDTMRASELAQDPDRVLPADDFAFRMKFRKTHVRDSKGAPALVFHSSHTSGFDVFDPYTRGDFGFHVGDFYTATKRAEAIEASSSGGISVDSRSYVAGYLQIERPLYLYSDPIYFWSLGNILQDMPGYEKMGEQITLINQSKWLTPEVKGRKIAAVLESYGFDGIIYDNGVESNTKSYMIWNPSQFKAYNNSQWSDDPGFSTQDISKFIDDFDFGDIEDPMTDNQQSFWSTYIHQPKFMNKSIYDVASAFTDADVFDADDPKSVIAGIRAAADSLSGAEHMKETKEVLNSLGDELEYVYRYMKSLETDTPLPPPFIANKTMDDTYVDFRDSKIYHITQLQNTLKGLDSVQQNISSIVSGKSSQILNDVPDDVALIFKRFGDDVSRRRTQMLHKAMHGGTFEGTDMTNAIQETMDILLDYSNMKRIDDVAKTVIPFWKYPSRSLPFWLKTMYRHPFLLSLYFRYLRYSRMEAKQRGFVNSKGEQLPSLRGYMPIPGTDLWFNPTAPLIYRYIYSENRTQDVIDDEDPAVTNIIRLIVKEGENRGFSVGPLVAAMLKHIIDDPYGRGDLTYELGKTALPFPAEITPPWIDRYVLGALVKMFNPLDDGYFTPQVKWRDLLIERQVLWTAMEAAEKEIDVEQRRAIFNRAALVLSDVNREQYPEWQAAQQEFDQDTYNRKLIAFATGMFTKSVDPMYAEIMRLRDELNLLRSSINDNVKAAIFKLDPVPEDRAERMKNLLYDDPAGQAYSTYQKMNFVIDPLTGKSVFDLERRKQIAQNYYEDEISQAYYDALREIDEERENALRSLPIPPSKTDTSKIWDDWSKARADIEANSMYAAAKRPWSTSYHTYGEINKHYEDVMWSIVRSTRPVWNKEGKESYDDYEKRVAAWEASLPMIIDTVLPSVRMTLIRDVQRSINTKNGFVFEDVVSHLKSVGNINGYKAWQLTKNSPFDALNNAWWEVYARDYDMVYDASGAQRELAKREFDKMHPEPPTFEELYDWISKTYGDKFKREEIWQAYIGREVFEINQYYDQTKVFPEEVNDIWTVLNLATNTPNGMKDLRTQYIQELGDEDWITMWYDSGGNPDAWKKREEFKMFHDRLISAAEKLNFAPLSDAQLYEKAEAEKLNEQFKAEVASRFGEDINDLVIMYAQLSYADKKSRQANHPEEKSILSDFYAFKDSYGSANQLWAKYYWDKMYRGTDGSGQAPSGYVTPYVSGQSYYSRVKKRKSHRTTTQPFVPMVGRSSSRK